MSVKDYVTWAQFGLKLLSLFEVLLPAFLVAWTAQLRGKVIKLESQLSYSEHKAEVLRRRAQLKEANRGKTPGAIIGDFLKRASRGTDAEE